MNELLIELQRLKQYGSQFNHVILIRLFSDYIIETDDRIKKLESFIEYNIEEQKRLDAGY